MGSFRRALEALKKVAPTAASTIAGGGPVGRLVEGMVANRLGVEPTPSAIEAAVVGDPDAAAKLAGVEAEIERARLEDVQHARETNGGHWMTWLLPLLLIGLYGGWLLLLAWADIPPANLARLNPDRVSSDLGVLVTAAVFYWLGSSRGSGEKQAALNAAMDRR